MLETDTLQGVGKLDVDAEIVGVELKLVALKQAALLIDIERQRRDRAIDRELPMAITGWIGPKLDPRKPVRRFALAVAHIRSYNTALMNSATIRSVSPAASRCGAWPMPG